MWRRASQHRLENSSAENNCSRERKEAPVLSLPLPHFKKVVAGNTEQAGVQISHVGDHLERFLEVTHPHEALTLLHNCVSP